MAKTTRKNEEKKTIGKQNSTDKKQSLQKIDST